MAGIDMPMTIESTLAQQVFMTNYLFVASVAILCYDHIITFDSEVRFIWSRPLHILPAIFLFIRYFGLVLNIIKFIFLFCGLPSNGCLIITLIRNTFIILVISNVSASQVWRILALFNYDKKFIFKIAPPYFIILGITAWHLPSETDMSDEYIYGCPYSTSEDDLPSYYMKCLWTTFLVWEVVIIALTIWKTWKSARYARRLHGRQFLCTIMLRDGIIYFIILAAIHFANLLTFLIKSRSFGQNSFAWMAVCVSASMTSRLMLNLRETTYASIDSDLVNQPNTVGSVGLSMCNIVLQQLGELDEEQVSS